MMISGIPSSSMRRGGTNRKRYLDPWVEIREEEFSTYSLVTIMFVSKYNETQSSDEVDKTTYAECSSSINVPHLYTIQPS